jgi:hypothetical protein
MVTLFRRFLDLCRKIVWRWSLDFLVFGHFIHRNRLNIWLYQLKLIQKHLSLPLCQILYYIIVYPGISHFNYNIIVNKQKTKNSCVLFLILPFKWRHHLHIIIFLQWKYAHWPKMRKKMLSHSRLKKAKHVYLSFFLT